MKIYKLKNNDIITVIKYLDNVDCYYHKYNMRIIYDDKKHSIKQYMFDLRNIYSYAKRYYAIVIINNEYKIIQYGRMLNLLFKYRYGVYAIRYELKIGGFKDFDKSYLINLIDINHLDINQNKINSLIKEFNLFLKKRFWWNEYNFDIIYNNFKEKKLHNLDIFKKPLRIKKIKRLNENKEI